MKDVTQPGVWATDSNIMVDGWTTIFSMSHSKHHRLPVC